MERIARELRGVPCLALEEVAPAKRQIVAPRSRWTASGIVGAVHPRSRDIRLRATLVA